jgi:dihydroxyacid dehydratase/phosphogluconate dehydratase
MHYRNLMALDTEAMLTAQPMDAAVLGSAAATRRCRRS